jgi:hypothetical protein
MYMAAVIEEKKRINAEIPLSLHRDIEAAGYKITEAIIKGCRLLLDGNPESESDCDQYKKETENFILAAESKLEARDRQIKEYSSWIEEKDKLIAKLNSRIQKLTAPGVKTWPNYLLGIRIIYLWLILAGFAFGMFTACGIFYFNI